MTSIVYAVNGGLEDWAYGFGWDRVGDAATQKCRSNTYPLDSDFFTRQSTTHIATAIFLIEMDDMKNPPENSYGARNVSQISNKSVTSLSSIMSSDSALNGHINRNIRNQLAMIDAAKPYI